MSLSSLEQIHSINKNCSEFSLGAVWWILHVQKLICQLVGVKSDYSSQKWTTENSGI